MMIVLCTCNILLSIACIDVSPDFGFTIIREQRGMSDSSDPCQVSAVATLCARHLIEIICLTYEEL